MFMCLECDKRFRSVKAAEKAMERGCPKCGGCDIDLAPMDAEKRLRELRCGRYAVKEVRA